MIRLTFFILTTLFIGVKAYAQFEPLNLTNVLIVGQQDKLEDKYSLELAVLNVLQKHGVKAKSSLNVLRQGEDPVALASKENQKNLLEEGIDTYMLVSVRGFDKRFTPSTNLQNLKEELGAGHLFPLWKETSSSVSFSITFYRNNVPVYYDLIRVTSMGSKDAVLKKFSKILDKKMRKEWK